MAALTIIFGQILGFILGTLILWGCSFTVDTPNANIKTAAIYNGIMTVFGAVLLGIAFLFLHTESSIAGGILLISTIAMLFVSFSLLMRMYIIRFWSTIWLVFAMWFVDVSVDKVFELLF